MSDITAASEELSSKGTLLRPFWARLFRQDIGFIIVTFVLLGIVRVIGLVRGEINIVVLGFLMMWVLPIIFLRQDGRKRIGINRPTSWPWLLLSFIIGGLAAVAINLIGYLLYGTGVGNWAMASAGQYIAQGEALIPVVFAVVTLLSMLFSPIGEELYFRGIIHEVLARKLSSGKWAGFWSSVAFALIHIPHHDVVLADVGLVGMLMPLLLWSIFMFLASYLFILARNKTGSIFGAISCHSGYILGMNLFIYMVLLPGM